MSFYLFHGDEDLGQLTEGLKHTVNARRVGIGAQVADKDGGYGRGM